LPSSSASGFCFPEKGYRIRTRQFIVAASKGVVKGTLGG